MRLAAASAFIAALALAAPAQAEPPFPTDDFSGTWVIQDGDGNELNARMHYSASEKAMRMEMSPGGMEMTVIRDMESGETVMWSSKMPGMGMRVNTPAELDVDATPTGETQSVNGQSCEVWRISSGTACLAEGNVPLRTEAEGTTAELRDLQRGPQDAALFQPPSDISIMTLENLGGMLKGMNLPNLPF